MSINAIAIVGTIVLFTGLGSAGPLHGQSAPGAAWTLPRGKVVEDAGTRIYRFVGQNHIDQLKLNQPFHLTATGEVNMPRIAQIHQPRYRSAVDRAVAVKWSGVRTHSVSGPCQPVRHRRGWHEHERTQ
jgi:hypothetical protein